MKRVFLSAILCLFFCSNCFAIEVTVPDEKIIGVDKLVPLGEIVRISLPKLDTSSVKYLANRSADFKIFDGDVEKQFITDGDSIILGTGVSNKKFKVFASVSYVYLIKDDKGAIAGVEVRTRLLTDFLKVGAEVPLPPPIPPSPPVTPTFPIGKYNLSYTTYKAVYAAVADDGQRASMALRLANNYDAMAARIAAGTVKDLKTALTEITNDNKGTLGTSAPAWNVFFEMLQNETYNFYSTTRTLTTAQDFQQACYEISAGLKAVK